MVRHIRSWLLPHAEAACPSVSRYLLLAMRRRASSQSVPLSESHPLSVASGFALLVAVRPDFFRDLEQGRKGKDLFLLDWEQVESFKGHVRRTDSVYSLLGIRSIRGRLDVETCFTRLILEIPTDRPTKACEKCRVSGKADMHKGEF